MNSLDTAKMEEYANRAPYRMLNNGRSSWTSKEYVNFD